MRAKSTLRLCFALALLGWTGAGLPALADTFLKSDDYKDGEEVVRVFLQEADYAIMVDEFERNGKSFDWGWVRTVKWEATQSGAVEPAKKGFLSRGKGPKLENEPGELAFQLSAYRTISVPEVKNFAGLVRGELIAHVHEALVLVAQQFGLQVAEAGAPADLELTSAVVDINYEGGGFGYIQVKPFIEIELRLRDLKSGEDLLLLRNQEHAGTPDDAAFGMASDLAVFLR